MVALTVDQNQDKDFFMVDSPPKQDTHKKHPHESKSNLK